MKQGLILVQKKNPPFSPLVMIFLSGALLLMSTISCSAEPESLKFETVSIEVGGVPLTVEIADTPAKRRRGLMYRETLSDETGMLFVFDEERRPSFWMKNTSLPLSLAYISREGVIREIHHLRPFSEDPVASRRVVLYALEVNQGWFAARGIAAGDVVTIPELP